MPALEGEGNGPTREEYMRIIKGQPLNAIAAVPEVEPDTTLQEPLTETDERDQITVIEALIVGNLLNLK